MAASHDIIRTGMTVTVQGKYLQCCIDHPVLFFFLNQKISHSYRNISLFIFINNVYYVTVWAYA